MKFDIDKLINIKSLIRKGITARVFSYEKVSNNVLTAEQVKDKL